MYNKIIEFLDGKNIAILGFGMEGKSTYNFIRRHLSNIHITIIDKVDIRTNNKELCGSDENLSVVYGENYLDNLEIYDVIIKTPGISLKNIDTTNLVDKIYSQLELLLMVDSKNVIGITGTKGKSTTSTLIYNVLKAQNLDVVLAGNIGIPVLDKIEDYKETTTLVVEMSSHQLEYVNYSPHIGIVLNLYEDHLDHAGSVEHYHSIKMHMFDYQNTNDISIYCKDNEALNNYVTFSNYSSNLYSFGLKNSDIYLNGTKIMYNGEVLYEDDGKRNLLGSHNLKNIMVVIFLAKLYNLDLEKAKKTIDSFMGLEHRLECVGTYDFITYYNDTIATIPAATIEGIKALKNVNTLIFGGMDRGINYLPLIDYLYESSISNLICMPTTGYKIGNILKEKTNKNIMFAVTLEEAVELAKMVTEKNKICLLSPAAPSYEYFKNFQEKGNCYKRLVSEHVIDYFNESGIEKPKQKVKKIDNI